MTKIEYLNNMTNKFFDFYLVIENATEHSRKIENGKGQMYFTDKNGRKKYMDVSIQNHFYYSGYCVDKGIDPWKPIDGTYRINNEILKKIAAMLKEAK